MSDPTPIVFVVDEDASVRAMLGALIERAGCRAGLFASAFEFLVHPRPVAPCCLVLDARPPDLTGLELQARVAVECGEMPVLFIASGGDVPTIVRAMKAGALGFLMKPLDAIELLTAVRDAIEHSRKSLASEAALRSLRARHRSLTPREKEVMALVVSGYLNKQVGGELGINVVTVKGHRGSVMRKMQASSLAQLIDMARRLGIGPVPPVRTLSCAHWRVEAPIKKVAGGGVRHDPFPL
jgi:FixJ family two-component response regulator